VPNNTLLVSANGINRASVTMGNALRCDSAGSPLLYDPFDGTVIDTAYRWNTPQTVGGGTVTQANGSLTLTTGVTASNAAILTSQENFTGLGTGTLSGGILLIPLAGPTLNTNVFIGYGTPGAGGGVVAATPITDGYGWEYDIAGTFGFSVYNAGVRTYRSLVDKNGNAFGAPQLGVPYILGINASPLGYQVTFGSNFEEPALTVQGFQPATSTLPFRFAVINHTAGPSTAASWITGAIVVFDSTGGYPVSFNGQAILRARAPGKFINLSAVGIAAETTIWTPAAGRRFRLMGYNLTSGTVGGNVTLKDNTAGTTILVLPFGAASQPMIVTPPGMGNGILSIAAGNVLTATGSATQTLSGYLIGTEE